MSGIAERLAEVRAGVWNVLADLIADHPMWIGDDGKPLDYSPEREALLADFVGEATDALLPVVEREIAAALVRSDLGRAAYEAGRAEVVARVDEVLGRQESDGLALRSLILAALSPDPDRGEGEGK